MPSAADDETAPAAATALWTLRWKRFCEHLAAALFAAMFIGFVIQIVSRYVFNSPVSWSLEVCSIAYVWVVFWSCDLLVSERKQIVFDLLYNAFPPPARRVLAIVLTGTLGLVFLAALPGVVDYVMFIARRSSMLLRVRMDLVYSCFVIFMVAVVVNAAVRIWRLLGRSWKDHL
ncbi:MAG TPA: TRAP transporter small permease subunit [Xanthobacteraceae bacterium]|nr:TRAP transporter small permease subunit [Xanthobacteraceae bacterium]